MTDIYTLPALRANAVQHRRTVYVDRDGMVIWMTKVAESLDAYGANPELPRLVRAMRDDLARSIALSD